MKRRYQVRNWIIYGCLLVGMGVYATYYGERIPKMVFGFMVMLPIICLIYSYTVYLRFCLWQEIPSVKIVKNQTVPYRLAISNEDFFAYSDIRVHFSKNYSKIDEGTLKKEFGLMPKSCEDGESTLCGMYRGTYFVGVDYIEVTDFFSIFSIRYPIRSKMKIIVWPRVVTLKNVNFLEHMQDQKNMIVNSNSVDSLPDLEFRKYVEGDPMKRIHWKATARNMELFTRKDAASEEMKTFLYVDTEPIEDIDRKIATEDKVIELALAISKYYLSKQEQIEIAYDTKSYPIATQRDFESFYHECINMYFESKLTVDSVLTGLQDLYGNELVLMVISPNFNTEIFKAVSRWSEMGVMVTYFYIKTKEDEHIESMIRELMLQGVHVETLIPEDDLEKAFK